MLSTIIRKYLQYLSIFFLNDMSKVKVNEKKIYNYINNKVKKLPKYKKNLKLTHQKFNDDLYKILLSNKLINFLRYSFIQKVFFVHNRLFILNELNYLKKSKKWSFYKKLIVEDNVGNPVRYFLYPKSSGNRINHVYHLSILRDKLRINLNKISNVFEFGGGYGCMARIFSKINENVNYIIFDTNLVNCLQYYYLKQNNLKVGFDQNQFFLTNNIKKIKLRKSIPESIFIANWSLSETPLEFRRKIIKIIPSYENILISFQENFENIDNLKYFNKLKLELNKKFKLYLLQNKFYKGNILKKQKHFFLIGKKLKKI
tara:strand:- start:2265 stop:3209 length:945 start_codon:yes stop_codon:yes gene_type:complete